LVSSDDVVCDPQPVVELIAASDVADSAGTLQLGDYRLIFSGAVPEDTLKTGMLVYGDEVLKIIKYEPFAFDQTVAAWQVTARAVN
jgi:hypothetical protein